MTQVIKKTIKDSNGKIIHGVYEFVDARCYAPIGILRDTVGKNGNSTGAFKRCKTDNPIEELKLEVIKII